MFVPVGGSASLPEIANSVRFDGAVDYISRANATGTDYKKWTWSGWVKRSKLGTVQGLFGAYASTANSTYWYFGSDDKLTFACINGTTQAVLSTSATYRDCSAWYHIVCILDYANATATDRVQVWVNNVRQAVTFTTTPATTANNGWNAAGWSQYNGTIINTTPQSFYHGGYLANIVNVEGQALTPSNFAYTDPNGQWRTKAAAALKALADSGGVNSWYLKFADGTNTTTLGADSSSKGNNFTLTSMTRAAGVDDSWTTDSPTNNFPAWSPISNGTATLSFGALTVAGGNQYARSSWVFPSGKWYFESTAVDAYAGSYFGYVGVASAQSTVVDSSFSGLAANTGGGVVQQGSLVYSYGTYAANDVYGFAFDVDANTLSVYKNGTQLGSTVTVATGDKILFGYFNGTADTSSQAINFGQRAFSYTPPTGFKSLSTKNLPMPSIIKPNKHFDVVAYTGTGATQNITSLNFEPGATWLKGRTGARSHGLWDTSRGATNYLSSHLTNAEATDATNGVTAFLSNGVTIGSVGTWNTNAEAFVAWNWKANGAPVSNTAGTITSQVSANTAAGFSVVTYTGNGTGSATVGHGLGVKPAMVIYKNRTAGASWVVLHTALGNQGSYEYYLLLNSTAAKQAAVSIAPINGWNSSVIPLGTDVSINANTNTYVAYCFTEVPGYSKIGSYAGNGSADGPFVYCGFRPKYVMMKCSSGAGNWVVNDTTRATYNVVLPTLYPDLANAEETGTTVCDITSNGFKLRTTAGNVNGSGATYVFYAIAETPFKFANAR